ncbi:MAG: hypothetical protein BWY73_00054 [candidate division TA06 bacterium ADurb.Bin417]|uniref:Uncharacterized protein n=1 Tax=candidate division TA06 bacterium ADurb.Bin417 TaxID=1852828 RepID=A0A1V5MLW0_UNCT6|nr:MAG: hypothetical protein BWY73_00054 [candidate division TA06 bacterium ADurb.Bin417]
MRSHGLHHVGHRQYSGFHDYLVPGQPVGISGTIHAFVVLQYRKRDRPGKFNAVQDVITGLAVGLDHLKLHLGQLAGLGQDFDRYDYLAHVMKQADDHHLLFQRPRLPGDGHRQPGHPALVSGRVRIAHFTHFAQGFDRLVYHFLQLFVTGLQTRLGPLPLGNVLFQLSVDLLQLLHLVFQLADNRFIVLPQVNGLLLGLLARGPGRRLRNGRRALPKGLLDDPHQRVGLRRLDDKTLRAQAEREIPIPLVGVGGGVKKQTAPASIARPSSSSGRGRTRPSPASGYPK